MQRGRPARAFPFLLGRSPSVCAPELIFWHAGAVLKAEVAAELARCVHLGLIVLEGVTVEEGDSALQGVVDGFAEELRRRYPGSPSPHETGADVARGLYRCLGLDPTKTRPSNEALLRRVLRGERLYRINTLVDSLNLCSLRHQLPFGLYDLHALHPPITLRRGAPGESYDGIRKGRVNVEGRPVLIDEQGPFGNPTSDSARSAVSLTTTQALVTLYAPAALGPGRTDEVLDDTAATLTRFCGGAVTFRQIVPGA